MESAYIVYYPDLAVPGARAAIRFFDDQAVQSGVRRLVLFSGRCEEEALLSEQALQDSGADWTILRSSWFCQNPSEDFLLEGERSSTCFCERVEICQCPKKRRLERRMDGDLNTPRYLSVV